MYGVAVYVPSFQKILQTVPLAGIDWLVLVVLSILNVVVLEIAKKEFFKGSTA